MGEHLTRWIVAAALLMYTLSLTLRLLASSSKNLPRLKLARGLWTGAWLCMLLHVLTAFHLVHHWDHAAAYSETARQTAEVVGLNWGGGIYINYLFLLLWGLDVCWWWRAGVDGYESRPRSANIAIQSFLAFIVFNGAVVFASPFTRILGLIGTVWLTVMLVLHMRRQASIDHSPETQSAEL